MLGLIIGALYVGTSANIVRRFRPNAFRGTDNEALVTDIALTAAGAVTVAPVVCACYALKHLAGVGMACVAVSRR